MIKLNYNAEAESPIHTGADENYGTTTMLRREKRRLKNPIKYESNFTSETEKRFSILKILLGVYKCIDLDLKSKNYGFYDAFSSKILSSTCVKSKFAFLSRLCESCGIRTINDNYIEQIKTNIDKIGDVELLQTIRDDHQYLMLMLKDAVKNGLEQTLDFGKDSKKISFEKNFEWIPFLSGNSIRGLIRRLVMRDFMEKIGISKEYGVEKEIYHQLMTGGNITSSTAFEDIELREKYINLCPMIGLLGSAIGNMTIQGKMKVGGLRPICLENGNGGISFWEMIGIDFGTRHDSSKTELDIKIEGENKGNPNQMKYSYEVFNIGTLFDGDFVLVSKDDLLISAFWYALKLLKLYGYVGGNSARGLGKLKFNIEIPKDAENIYLSHLENVKSNSLEFFGVKRLNNGTSN